MTDTDGGVIRRRSYSQVTIGLIFMAAGLLIFLDRIGTIELGDLSRLWPLILIAIGASRFLGSREDRGLGTGLWLILTGLWFLGVNYDFMGMSYRNSWPLLLVLVGVSMVWRALFDRGRARPAGGDGGEARE